MTEAMRPASFVHAALFYEDPAAYVRQVTGFLRAGLSAGEPVFVVVPARQAGWLRDELGSSGNAVRFEDMAEVGRNPAWIIPLIQEFSRLHSGKHVRYVGEPIWRSRSTAELREATRHEALINLAFTGADAAILCPYDTTALHPDVIADARRTHPVLAANGSTAPSPAYAGPGTIPASCLVPLTRVADAMAYTYTSDLSAVRTVVENQARTAGLPRAKVVDLVLAVSEVAANTLQHAHSPGTLEISHNEHEVVCTLHDKGIIDDPLVGRRRPEPGATEGHGLWLVHQVCDLVELRSDNSGTTIRLPMRIHPA